MIELLGCKGNKKIRLRKDNFEFRFPLFSEN